MMTKPYLSDIEEQTEKSEDHSMRNDAGGSGYQNEEESRDNKDCKLIIETKQQSGSSEELAISEYCHSHKAKSTSGSTSKHQKVKSEYSHPERFSDVMSFGQTDQRFSSKKSHRD